MITACYRYRVQGNGIGIGIGNGDIQCARQVLELKGIVVCGVGGHGEFQDLLAGAIGTIMVIGWECNGRGVGAPVGYLTTLRNDKMYEFVDRLINIALPHVRDFHGVSRTAFDKQGNYNLGLKEQTVFPEITFEDAAVLHGLEVTFIIKNGSKEGSTKLLELFGMPFEKEAK